MSSHHWRRIISGVYVFRKDDLFWRVNADDDLLDVRFSPIRATSCIPASEVGERWQWPLTSESYLK